MQTLGELINKHTRLRPDKLAVICHCGERLTFSELNERVNRLANGLINLGIKKGDRICILENNCHRLVEIYFAFAKIGAVAVPLNCRLAIPEFTYIINNSEAETFLVGREFLGIAGSMRQDLPKVKTYISLGVDIEGMLNYDAITQSSKAIDPSIAIEEEDVVFQFYTSGTTGRPKGCMLTHRNFIASSINMAIELKLTEDDICLDVLPIWHLGDATYLMAMLYIGGPSVIIREFDPVQIFKAIEEHKITLFILVPETWRWLVDHADINKHDLTSIRLLLHGGAPMPLPVLKRLREVFDVQIVAQYGQTECTNIATILPDKAQVVEGTEAELERSVGSCGREIVNVAVRVVDENDNDVPLGMPGEVVVKGPIVMKGYWKMPEQTEETLKGGWLHTGDIAKMDAEGFIYLMDRSKDMIRSASENIYPREIEQVIEKHPAVREVAVIGIPDEKWGETVKALVVLNEGASVTEEEIIELCKQNMASYKKPKSVEFWDEPLPRNFTGKILKKELREPYWKGYAKRIN